MVAERIKGGGMHLRNYPVQPEDRVAPFGSPSIEKSAVTAFSCLLSFKLSVAGLDTPVFNIPSVTI